VILVFFGLLKLRDKCVQKYPLLVMLTIGGKLAEIKILLEVYSKVFGKEYTLPNSF